MTDVNEQSFSAGINSDSAVAQTARPHRNRIPAPILRFRSTLQPISVVRTIRTRIIPKIVLALRSTPKTPEAAKQDGPDAISRFASLVMGEQEAAAFRFVQEMMAQGSSVESVFLDLLAPTAQYLGELWESDATDFANVTIGVGRLQLIMRQLCDKFCEHERPANCGESALLTTTPGEQHSFGLSMVAEFFRRSGWNLCTGPFSSHQELTSLVHNHWFDVVGFSVSSDRRLNELKQDIHDIRRDSRNKNVGIMLGGPMMIRDPGLVESMGADMMSLDAATAPQQAHDLIERRKNS
ncbi:MAG: cobalamin B12-binding domain-containing protein [Proteobacteria bacterium]|nr:cobalamin B12-binding domain-containing protein [Pseudomonadota bacterium]